MFRIEIKRDYFGTEWEWFYIEIRFKSNGRLFATGVGFKNVKTARVHASHLARHLAQCNMPVNIIDRTNPKCVSSRTVKMGDKR